MHCADFLILLIQVYGQVSDCPAGCLFFCPQHYFTQPPPPQCSPPHPLLSTLPSYLCLKVVRQEFCYFAFFKNISVFTYTHTFCLPYPYLNKYLYLFFLIYFYLSGCFGSQLQHSGSSLHHVESFIVAHRPCSCGMWAQLPYGMWDLSSPTRGRTHVPCIAWQILNHWTTREMPINIFLLGTVSY